MDEHKMMLNEAREVLGFPALPAGLDWQPIGSPKKVNAWILVLHALLCFVELGLAASAAVEFVRTGDSIWAGLVVWAFGWYLFSLAMILFSLATVLPAVWGRRS